MAKDRVLLSLFHQRNCKLFDLAEIKTMHKDIRDVFEKVIQDGSQYLLC